MSEWISVKDQLPEIGERVLVTAYEGGSLVAERAGLLKDVEWHWKTQFGFYLADIYTHWMPLPKPPTPDLTIEEALKLAVLDLSLFANYFCGGTRATHEGISAACGRVVRYREVLERAGK